MDIYYGIWSYLSSWTQIGRAALVLGFFGLFVFLCIPPIFCLIIFFLKKICKIIYAIFNYGFDRVMSDHSFSERAVLWNRITDVFDNIDILQNKVKEGITKHKLRLFLWIVVFYVLLLFFIGLPGWCKDIIDDSYLPTFSIIHNIYTEWEDKHLEKASHYTPIFKPKKEVSSNEGETTVEETQEEKIILTLTALGKYGSNIRAEASGKSTVLFSVGGDIYFYYVTEKNGWIYVQLEDGREGWIRDNLVEEVHEEHGE